MTKAERVAHILRQIKGVRDGMYSRNGWSWAAAGYKYDPDEANHATLQRLLVELDAALAPDEAPATPDDYWR